MSTCIIRVNLGRDQKKRRGKGTQSAVTIVANIAQPEDITTNHSRAESIWGTWPNAEVGGTKC